MKVFFLSLLVSTANLLSAQPDNTTLLKEVETQLIGGTSVSQILTDKKYLSIHPDTNFRELIEKFSSDKTLAIAPSDEPGKKIQVICTVKNEAGNVMPVCLAM